MNWWSSNVFKSDWFASRWFTYVTIPVVPPMGMGGIGGIGAYGGLMPVPKLYRVNLPHLFGGARKKRHGKAGVPVTTTTFSVGDIFDTSASARRSRRRRHRRRRTRPGRTSLGVSGLRDTLGGFSARNLDSGRQMRAAPHGRVSECACRRIVPFEMRDAFGDFTVLGSYCVTRDEAGRAIRHLG